MPRLRKASWAIVIFTALMALWIVSGVSGASNNCAGMTGDQLTTCQAGTAIGGGIAVTLLFMIWFVGFVVLAIVWFMSRPKDNVTVFGPAGQQVVVSEQEAKNRVERQGWTYQRPSP
jgi:hypothetical protein